MSTSRIVCLECGGRIDMDPDTGPYIWAPTGPDDEPSLQDSMPVLVGEACCAPPGPSHRCAGCRTLLQSDEGAYCPACEDEQIAAALECPLPDWDDEERWLAHRGY